MASALLSCTICPRQPSFSDTSHLLTHISSKGHLSHLHKLQVRSHQEIGAGHQLALYNQWYQDHGLGALLSERLLQKEAKGVERRTVVGQRRAQVKRQPLPEESLYSSVSPSHVEKRAPGKRWLKQDPLSEEESDYISSPVTTKRSRKTQRNLYQPIKQSSSSEHINKSDIDCPAEDDPEFPLTPDNSKLKGVIWPGMDLFDAATAEMRRRRNQKKDGSTLKLMEKNSETIEPTEVIYLPEGTIKERHIDGLVHSSSPLRGETPPISKQPTRRKRQPLAATSANVSRLPRRTGKAAQAHVASYVRDAARLSRRGMDHLPSSSTGDSQNAQSQYTPTEDDNMEFKLTVGNLDKHKKAGHFAIFNDSEENSYDTQPRSRMIKEEYPQSYISTRPHHAPPAPPRPQFSYLTAPWLQLQDNQALPAHQPYNSYGNDVGSQNFQAFGWAREAMPPMYAMAGHSAEMPNPFGVSYSHTTTQGFSATQFGPVFGGLLNNPRLDAYDDPFGSSRNPLSVALDHMQAVRRSEDTDGIGSTDWLGQQASPTKHNRSSSPSGTISDHDSHVESGFPRRLFTTAE